MNEKPIYKCVVFAATHPTDQIPLHPFVWNSALMNSGEVTDICHPEDMLTHLIEYQDCHLDDLMGFPEFVGLSVWRGTVTGLCLRYVCSNTDRSEYRPSFQGKWSDLSEKDWELLKRRNLSDLVCLKRFVLQ